MTEKDIQLTRLSVTQLKELYTLVFVEEDADEERTTKIICATDALREITNDALFDAVDKSCFEQAWQLTEDIHSIIGGSRITSNGIKALKTLIARTLETFLSNIHCPLIINVSEEFLQTDKEVGGNESIQM